MRDDENMKAKYHQLKTAMFTKKVTQDELAKEIGVSEQTLNNKLNGRGEFYINEAEKIIEFLALENPTEYFFNRCLRDT